MWAKIITIKRTKKTNYFSLCALNLCNTRVSQFDLNYWNKWTFPQHSNLLRCTSVYIYIYIHIHTYLHTHTYIYIYVYVCVYIHHLCIICFLMALFIYIYIYISNLVLGPLQFFFIVTFLLQSHFTSWISVMFFSCLLKVCCCLWCRCLGDRCGHWEGEFEPGATGSWQSQLGASTRWLHIPQQRGEEPITCQQPASGGGYSGTFLLLEIKLWNTY